MCTRPWLRVNRGQAQSWTAFTNSTRGFTKLTLLDVSRNALTGTLPPELGSLSSVGFSAFDNNITGTGAFDRSPP